MPSDRGSSFACDRCGLEGFRTYDDAASHESQCGPPPPPPGPPRGMGMGGGGGGPMMGGGGGPGMMSMAQMGRQPYGHGGMGGMMMGYHPPPPMGGGGRGSAGGGVETSAAGGPGTSSSFAGMGPPSPARHPSGAGTLPADHRKRRRPGGGGRSSSSPSPPPPRPYPGGAPASGPGGYLLPRSMAPVAFRETFALPRLVLDPEEDLRASAGAGAGASSNLCLGLSDVDSLACRHIEAFRALDQDVAAYPPVAEATWRRMPEVGDVGLRCVHCAGDDERGRQRNAERPAVLFPATVGALPDDLRFLAEMHLSSCPSAPEPVQSNIMDAIISERRSDGAGHEGNGSWRRAALLDYSVDFCRRGGIYDKNPTGTGLVVRPAAPDVREGGDGSSASGLMAPTPLMSRRDRQAQQQAAGAGSSSGGTPRPRGSPAESMSSQPSGSSAAPPPQHHGQPGPPPQGRHGPPPSDFPYFHDGYGAWVCKYCCSAPYPYRAPGYVMQGPPHLPPEPAFIDSHMRVCRGGYHPMAPIPPMEGPEGAVPPGYAPRGYPGGPPPHPYGPPHASPTSQEGQDQRMGVPPPPPSHPYYPTPPPPYMGGPYPPLPPHMMGYEGGHPPTGRPEGSPMILPGVPPPPGLPPPSGHPVPIGAGPLPRSGAEPPPGTDAALRTAIDYLEDAEQTRQWHEEEAASSGQKSRSGEGAASSSSSSAKGAPPSPASEIVELVVPDDKLLLTDYFYYLMRQLKLCRFSESDRKTRGGKRENVPVGYGGLQCVHCSSAPNSRKFFWSNVDRLANSFAEIPGHVLKCRRCPGKTKDALAELKSRHPEQMAKLPRGSQKVFFRRMWRRLHDDDPQQDEDAEGEEKTESKAKKDKNSDDEAKPPSTAVASPTKSASIGPSRNPGGREATDEDDRSNEIASAAGTMQGVFTTPIAPRGARNSAGITGGGDIAAEEEDEEESSPRKRSRTLPSSSPRSASRPNAASPATLTVSSTTEEAARALLASTSQSPTRKGRRTRVLLAIKEDKDWLSDTDCFVRSIIEVFVATARDVEEARQDRKYPISEGQVGIRCLHCASTTDDAQGTKDESKTVGARGNAVAYPYSISGIYESVREFQRLHLESCPNLTPEIRERLLGQRGASSLSSVLRRYYVKAARALGMDDTNDGIRASGESVGVDRASAFEFSSGGIGSSGKLKSGSGKTSTPSPAAHPRAFSMAAETPLSRSIEGLGIMGIATPAGFVTTPGMGMGSPLMGTPAPTPPHLLGRTSGAPSHRGQPHHLGPPQAAGVGQPSFDGMGLESTMMTPLEGRKRKASSKARNTPPKKKGNDGNGRKSSG